MGILTRMADGEKVRRKINGCRDAGLKVFDNFITGVTTIEHDSIMVLRCSRQGPNQWKLEYNEEFWEEVDAPGEVENTQATQTLASPFKR